MCLLVDLFFVTLYGKYQRSSLNDYGHQMSDQVVIGVLPNGVEKYPVKIEKGMTS